MTCQARFHTRSLAQFENCVECLMRWNSEYQGWGERTDDPLEGYFTCYKSYLVHCRLWFPILEAMIWDLNRFELSISHLNHWSSTPYRHLGSRLWARNVSWRRSLWVPPGLQQISPLHMFRLVLCNYMSIIKGTISNAHAWNKCFFFVQISGASVKESCIPVFRREWNFQHGTMVRYLPLLSFGVFWLSFLFCSYQPSLSTSRGPDR